jgi:ribonuclease BN (tRNA processing enzyme)
MRKGVKLSSCLLALLAIGASGPAVSSQDAHAPAKASRLILLGTAGGPVIRKFRSQPASLLVVNGRPFLIDAGEGTMRQLAWAGFSARQVERLFLTHLHFDHTAGVPSLIAFHWIGRASSPLEIYGPPGTTEMVKRAVAFYDLSAPLFAEWFPGIPAMQDSVKAHDVDVDGPRIVYRDPDVTVSAVENTHYVTSPDQATPFGRKRTYAYRFEMHDRTIVFTGDTGPSDAVTALARGADVLVSEVIDIEGTMRNIRAASPPSTDLSLLESHQAREHLTPEEVGKLGQAAGVKLIVLDHVAFGGDDETDFSRYVDGVRRFYHGPVVIGKDLEEF